MTRQVLVAGGNNDTSDAPATAELFNPATGKVSSTGSMTAPRSNQTATTLPNRQVLIAGGEGGNTSQLTVLASAELHNPSSGTFTATGSMASARVGHTATLLPAAQVLIAGGSTDLGGTDPWPPPSCTTRRPGPSG